MKTVCLGYAIYDCSGNASRVKASTAARSDRSQSIDRVVVGIYDSDFGNKTGCFCEGDVRMVRFSQLGWTEDLKSR